jgi:excisionase family DNA binding protein
MTSPYLTTAELAELLRRPVETVRYWRFVGRGPASFKLGRRVLYDRADVERWIADERAAQSGVA